MSYPHIESKEDYLRYLRAVEEGGEGLEHVHPGPCPGCEECGLPEEPDEEEYELASEPWFSWRACELCGRFLGGNRVQAHGFDEDGEIVHLDVCVDCEYLLCYGRLDDRTMTDARLDIDNPPSLEESVDE